MNGKGPGELEFLLIKVRAKVNGNAIISINPEVLADVEGQTMPVSGNSLTLSID